MTKVLELRFQHQSFQWIFRLDFLEDWLVWSTCFSPHIFLYFRFSNDLLYHFCRFHVYVLIHNVCNTLVMKETSLFLSMKIWGCFFFFSPLFFPFLSSHWNSFLCTSLPPRWFILTEGRISYGFFCLPPKNNLITWRNIKCFERR